MAKRCYKSQKIAKNGYLKPQNFPQRNSNPRNFHKLVYKLKIVILHSYYKLRSILEISQKQPKWQILPKMTKKLILDNILSKRMKYPTIRFSNLNIL